MQLTWTDEDGPIPSENEPDGKIVILQTQYGCKGTQLLAEATVMWGCLLFALKTTASLLPFLYRSLGFIRSAPLHWKPFL